MPTNHKPGRFRDRSLMLNPAPVIGAALAVFAIAFGGLSLRLASGHDPALNVSASVQRATGAHGAVLSTRASGAAAGSGTGTSARRSTSHGAVVTTASGARGGTGRNGGSDA
jgi:hypothetical protein